MKILKYFLILVSLLISSSVFSQKFKGGLLSGLSTSQVDGDTQKGFNKLGVFAGVSVATEFTRVVGAKIELYYIGKGAKQNSNGVEIFKSKLHYVEMPFLLTLKPLEQFEFDLGVACSYLIGSKLYEKGAEVPDGLNDMKDFDLGGIASASYYFSGNIGFNVRMEYSLMPIKNNPNWFNYNLSFGLVYKLNNKP